MLRPIVNEHDEIVTYKEKADMLPTDIYRVCGLTVVNTSKKVLLTQRALDKKHDPGKWSFGVGWTVDKDETYEESVIRETFEELGIKITDPLNIDKYLSRSSTNNFFSMEYMVWVPDDVILTLEQDEIIDSARHTKEEIDAMFLNDPEKFVQSFWNVWRVVREKI